MALNPIVYTEEVVRRAIEDTRIGSARSTLRAVSGMGTRGLE
jgi:hypothetical protein